MRFIYIVWYYVSLWNSPLGTIKLFPYFFSVRFIRPWKAACKFMVFWNLVSLPCFGSQYYICKKALVSYMTSICHRIRFLLYTNLREFYLYRTEGMYKYAQCWLNGYPGISHVEYEIWKLIKLLYIFVLKEK